MCMTGFIACIILWKGKYWKFDGTLYFFNRKIWGEINLNFLYMLHVTICPRNNETILSKLLHKMGHYFLDTQYYVSWNSHQPDGGGGGGGGLTSLTHCTPLSYILMSPWKVMILLPVCPCIDFCFLRTSSRPGILISDALPLQGETSQP